MKEMDMEKVDKTDQRKTEGSFFEHHEWTQGDYAQVAEILQLKLITEELKEGLATTSVRYEIHRIQAFPRQSDMAKYLVRLKKDTDRLIETIEKMDDLSQQRLLLVLSSRGKSTSLLSNLEDDLRTLASTLRDLAPAPHYDKGGRSANHALIGLIRELATLYRDATKENPKVGWGDVEQKYVGRFYDLVTNVIRIIGCEMDVGSNSAFGKSIQRTLKKLQ
jgi:hypothetical protein